MKKFTKVQSIILFLFLTAIIIISFTECKKVNFNEVKADFYTANCPCQEKSVIYFVNKSDFADSYEWNFGNGSGIDNRRNPEYRFDKQGKYTITLKAFRANKVDVITKDILIYKSVE